MKLKVISFGIPTGAALLGVFLLAAWLHGDHLRVSFAERLPGADKAGAAQQTRKNRGAAGASTTSNEGGSAIVSAAGSTAVAVAGATPQQGGNPIGAVFATGPGSPRDLPGSWPQFRGTNLDDISTEKVSLARTWGAQGPPVLWSLALGEGHAGAAVYKGRVYLLDYDQQNRADVLRCLSLADGKEIWKWSYPVEIKRNHGMSRTIPAVNDKYVVTLGPKCQVLCVDSMTGEYRWSMDLTQEFGTKVPAWYAGQCPFFDGDKVLLAPGAPEALVVALDSATGRIAWKTPNPNGWTMTHSSLLPYEFAGKRMFIYCHNGGVVGVSAKDGSLLWETSDWKVKIANVPTPVPTTDGKIFFSGGYGCGSAMIQLTDEGGKIVPKLLFKREPTVFGSDQQTPIFYKGYIYGVIPKGELVCLNLEGNQVWASGSTHRFGLGPYLLADGLLYLLSDTGELTIVDPSPEGYRQLAQAKILEGPDAWAPMAIAGGRLLARDLTKLVCLNVAK